MKLYFKGKQNRDATIQQLLQSEGMNNATDIVISGCSAGGEYSEFNYPNPFYCIAESSFQ